MRGLELPLFYFNPNRPAPTEKTALLPTGPVSRVREHMDDPYAPSLPSAAGPRRRLQQQEGTLGRSASAGSISAMGQPSPITTRSGRALGAVGGSRGAGYSPYARRTRQAAAPVPAEPEQDEELDQEDDRMQDSSSPVQPRKGLFGVVGRALGSIFRSSSTKTLPTSNSLKDVRKELAGVQQQSLDKKAAAGGMSRSRTSNNLVGAAGPPPSFARSGQQQLPSSSSLSALSNYNTQPRSTSRSAHSTLVLPPSTSSNNLFNPARATSPALSSTSNHQYANRNRSPSPTRNGLAGSMSTFNLASSAVGSPSASTFGAPVPSAFGLQSRSPFAQGGRSPSLPRSASVSGSQAGDRPGSSLFPYTSTIPRGGSPLSSSQSTSNVSLSHKRSYTALGSTATPGRARMGSPLNPYYAASAAGGAAPLGGLGLGGEVERARKKQLVWDPSRGLVSRESVEKDREA